MNIVFVCHTGLGGHIRYTAELADALASSSDTTTVLTGAGPALHPRHERLLHRVFPAPDTGLSGARRVIDRIRVYLAQPRIISSFLEENRQNCQNNVHFQQLPTLFPGRALRAAARKGFHTVLTVHNVKPHEATLAQAFLARIARSSWKHADVLVVHTTALEAELRNYVGSRSSIVVVPHLVWSSSKVLPQKNPDRDYLFFGHLRPSKGLDYFLAALALAGDPQASIVGQGTPEAVAAARRAIGQLGLQNVHLDARFVDEEEIPTIFARHRVVVAPYTRFSAQSGVTHLAIAHDRPIVATRVGGLPELIDSFGVGETCEPSDASSLKDAMLEASRLAREDYYDVPLRAARRALSADAMSATLRRPYMT